MCVEDKEDKAPKAVAYRSGDRQYVTIQKLPDGYELILYDSYLREVSYQLIYAGDAQSINDIINDISQHYLFMIDPLESINYADFVKKTIAVSNDRMDRYPIELTSGIYRREKGLNWLSRAVIENRVIHHVSEKLEQLPIRYDTTDVIKHSFSIGGNRRAKRDMEELRSRNDVLLLGARVFGSRTREGLYREDSDVNIMIFYEGEIPKEVISEKIGYDGMEYNILFVQVKDGYNLRVYIDEAERLLNLKEKAEE